MNARALPSRSALASHWTLSDEVVFLNHGSFGATPRMVLEAQSELRARLESEPVRFMLRELEPLIDASRDSLAALVHCDAEGLAFVSNATAGVNTVLRSLDLSPGDELVTTDHEYNACKNALDFVAERSGVRVVVVRIPLPVASQDEVVAAIDAELGPKTRLLLIDHVTSPTALVMPVEAIAKCAHRKGIDVLVDGAHAPGMLPLSIDALGVAYYTANCHKWICAPKGAAMLYVRKDKRDHVRPLSISHGANSLRTDRAHFRLEHDWTGTCDPTAAICVKHAIDFMSRLWPGGLAELMQRNRRLALHARTVLCDALGQRPECPDGMIGSMAAVRLPDRQSAAISRSVIAIEPLQDRLFEAHAIEVPIVPWPASPKRLVRVSAQAYNAIAEYEYLAEALKTALAAE